MNGSSVKLLGWARVLARSVLIEISDSISTITGHIWCMFLSSLNTFIPGWYLFVVFVCLFHMISTVSATRSHHSIMSLWFYIFWKKIFENYFKFDKKWTNGVKFNFNLYLTLSKSTTYIISLKWLFKIFPRTIMYLHPGANF